MSFTNLPKPSNTKEENPTKLNIGSSFRLVVGGAYHLIVGAGTGTIPVITNIYKDFKTRWDTWDLPWEENTVHSWDDLVGNIQTNIPKVSVGETWATIETTWATETRSWLAASQLFINEDRPAP